MSSMMRKAAIVACVFTYFGAIRAKQAQAQITDLPPLKNAKNISPELIGNLTKKLSITPEQAAGGSGAIFGLAKTKLKPEDFANVAGAVPGMDGLLNAAPKPKSDDPMAALADMLPGEVGGIASLAGTFKSLGLSPSMAMKFVPIMTKFVDLKGGAEVGKLLSGVLK